MNNEWQRRVFFAFDGQFQNDAADLIQTTYFDLRDPAERTPIRTLFKGCSEKHAIDLECRTIRLSKPSGYQTSGDGLIKDPGEGLAERVVSERTNDPDDLRRAQTIDDETNKLLEQTGFSMEQQTRSITVRETHKLTYGNYWWVYSTAIAPNSEEEMKSLRTSLSSTYNHFTRIHRPITFAQSLGNMVAEQLGPQGKEGTMTHKLDRVGEFQTRHKTQWIMHGPVWYVDDTYEAIGFIQSTMGGLEIPAQIFVKNKRYSDQREYRFAVLTENGETKESIELSTSLAMRGALVEMSTSLRPNPSKRPISQPKEVSRMSDQGHKSGVHEIETSNANLHSVLFCPDEKNIAFAPREINPLTDNEPCEGRRRAQVVLEALRHAVCSVPQDYRIRVASSAWWAESFICELCRYFHKPVDTVCVVADEHIQVKLNFSQSVGASSGTFTVGPNGVYALGLKMSNQEIVSSEKVIPTLGSIVLSEKNILDLEQTGLVRLDNSNSQ